MLGWDIRGGGPRTNGRRTARPRRDGVHDLERPPAAQPQAGPYTVVPRATRARPGRPSAHARRTDPYRRLHALSRRSRYSDRVVLSSTVDSGTLRNRRTGRHPWTRSRHPCRVGSISPDVAGASWCDVRRVRQLRGTARRRRRGERTLCVPEAFSWGPPAPGARGTLWSCGRGVDAEAISWLFTLTRPFREPRTRRAAGKERSAGGAGPGLPSPRLRPSRSGLGPVTGAVARGPRAPGQPAARPSPATPPPADAPGTVTRW